MTVPQNEKFLVRRADEQGKSNTADHTIASGLKNASAEYDEAVLSTARRFLEYGISAFPLLTAKKAPLSGANGTRKEWGRYKQSPMSYEEFVKEYVELKSDGIGIYAGTFQSPKNGKKAAIAVLDFDLEGEAFEPWKAAVCATEGGKALFARLRIDSTQSGGKHVIARLPADVPAKRELLAGRPMTEEETRKYEADLAAYKEAWKAGRRGLKEPRRHTTLIEVLFNQFCVMPPSKGYRAEQGDALDVPYLSKEEWETLCAEARRLDARPKNEEAREENERGKSGSRSGWKKSPGDAFNESPDVLGKVRELLAEHGWEEAESGAKFGKKCWHYRRPGKETGISATLFEDGAFHVFTTEAPPFQTQESYSPFAVYAMLEHVNELTGLPNWNAAASALHEEGYGEKAKQGRPESPTLEYARGFLRDRCSVRGFNQLGLRRYRQGWFEYIPAGRWREVGLRDLYSRISDYLQENGATASKTLVQNVIVNLDSTGLCAMIERDYTAPCRISDRARLENVLSVRNGVLDVRKAAHALECGWKYQADARPNPMDALIPHSPDLFLLNGVDYPFDPKATCPKWEGYLNDVLPNAGDREIAQMLAGYLLTPDTSLNVFFVLYGEGGTGKTVFMKTLAALLGEENVCDVPFAQLGDRFGRAKLGRCLASISDEMCITNNKGEFARVFEELKKITSGSMLHLEMKNIEPWDAPATARLVYSTNELPYIADRSNGTYDRMRILPLNTVIRGKSKENPRLCEELREELSGILNWALRGYAKVQAVRRFPESEEGARLKQTLRNDCDGETAFLREATEAGGEVFADSLYNAYKFALRNEGRDPVSATRFARAVQRLYPRAYKERRSIGGGHKAIQRTIWQNVRMRKDYVPPESEVLARFNAEEPD